jgi:hypothetical protein
LLAALGSGRMPDPVVLPVDLIVRESSIRAPSAAAPASSGVASAKVPSTAGRPTPARGQPPVPVGRGQGR